MLIIPLQPQETGEVERKDVNHSTYPVKSLRSGKKKSPHSTSHPKSQIKNACRKKLSAGKI